MAVESNKIGPLLSLKTVVTLAALAA